MKRTKVTRFDRDIIRLDRKIERAREKLNSAIKERQYVRAAQIIAKWETENK